jgi:hypothetical protein
VLLRVVVGTLAARQAARSSAAVTPLKLNALNSAFWWFTVLMCICGTSSTT